VSPKFKRHTIVIDNRNKENGEGRVTQTGPYGTWVRFKDGHYWYAYNNIKNLVVSPNQLSWVDRFKLTLLEYIKDLAKSINR
jgi:hypothetical protein